MTIEGKLRKFKKDTGYFKDYDHMEFDKPGVLIRLFCESSSKGIKTNKPLYVDDGKGGFNTQDKVRDKVHPYALVIKTGEGVDKYEAGEMIQVPSEDVMGTVWTAEFMEFVKGNDIKGAKPQAPRGMRETIPKVERSWEGFRIRNSFIENDESLTFFVPLTRVLGRIKL